MHDAEQPGTTLCGGPDAFGDQFHFPQQRDAFLEQDPSGVGQCDSGRAAVEKGGAEFPFKDPDLLREPRLGNVQPLRRSPEMQLLGEHGEVSQPPQLHPAMITSAYQDGIELYWTWRFAAFHARRTAG
jgi:hypothetical protein